MLLKILQYPDPLLAKVSEPVVDFDSDLHKLINDMVETALATDNCVGLAGIQVGVPRRVAIIKQGNKFITIINPEIIYKSGSLSSEWEGCMSVGEGPEQLFSKVDRDSRITVKYVDKFNNVKTRQCKDFLAHAFEHEIDHMNGILFLNHVKDPTHIWKDKELNEYYEKNNTLPL